MSWAIDIAGTGFTVLDRVYSNNRKVIEELGGSCGNVLISLAQLNRKVAPLLKLGEDQVGELLVQEFEKAGADTSFISMRHSVSSPILAETLRAESGQHTFSFTCPETKTPFPRHVPIDAYDLHHARSLLAGCAIFYTDRLSESIARALEEASANGAWIFFEPSSLDDKDLFARAVKVANIIKCSADRIPHYREISAKHSRSLMIVTHGHEGLEVIQGSKTIKRAAIPANRVIDTCGSGDMVSVGIIDWMLAAERSFGSGWTAEMIMGGVVAGQRLAAANCSFAGARGLFRRHGPQFARRILDGDFPMGQLELFEENIEIGS